MNKFLLLPLAFLLACQEPASDTSSDQEPGSHSPNIILVFVDDLGYGDLACYGQTRISTPNLDRMAAEGMKFTDFYAGAPVCAPSRHSLMTGMHTGHTAVRSNINQLPLGQYPMPDEATTMAEMLKSQGYATAAIGKWGMGAPGNSGDPLSQGFDHFFGYYCQAMAHNYYPTHLWRNHDSVLLPNEVRYVGRPWIDRQLSVATKREVYSADLFQKEAISFIDQEKNNGPFFLYYAATLPHANGEAPEDERFEIPDWGQYADSAWTPMEKGYAAMVTMLDDQVGEIMQKLQEEGLAENTLLIFTSDNGPTEFAARFESSGIYRGIKRDLYEGGTRVPMIAWWPGTIPAGRVSATPAAAYDFWATFADMTESASDVRTDGQSMLPVLRGDSGPADRLLYWEFYEGDRQPKQAIRQGEWKLIRFRFDDPTASELELYHLTSDPSETINLAGEQSVLVDSLLQMMEQEHEVYELEDQ